MKYLNKFATEEAYNAFKTDEEYVVPNVCLVGNKIKYNPELPFWVEALEDITVFWYDRNYSPSLSYPKGSYSFDLVNWTEFEANKPVSVSSGTRVYIINTSINTSTYNNGVGQLSASGRCNIGGNLLSLAYGEDYKSHVNDIQYPTDYMFFYTFSKQPIVDASELLFPICVGVSCYYNMFSGCSELEYGPAIIPLSSAYTDCCCNMFSECTSLKKAPVLPLLTLGSGTGSYYSAMFRECSSLEYIKALYTTNINTGSNSASTKIWVRNVSPKGVFVKNADATWNIVGDFGVPTGWEIKVYDVNTKRTFIRFKINDKTYEADENMTWSQWVSSKYNTAGLSVSGSNLVTSAGTLSLGGTAVLSTDLVTCIAGTDYTIA